MDVIKELFQTNAQFSEETTEAVTVTVANTIIDNLVKATHDVSTAFNSECTLPTEGIAAAFNYRVAEAAFFDAKDIINSADMPHLKALIKLERNMLSGEMWPFRPAHWVGGELQPD